MAYLALYRAFRPESLDKVVRQEHIVKILRNQIEQNRIGHAYLFCGPRGTGKTSIAKIFARSINCLSQVNGSPCGECAACKSLKNGLSLDVVEIDAASNNGVDEMRELREKVQYPPVNGRYKVYIIDEVHMLSAGAFNALLKTLEEPPKHAVFILATTEAQKIPATILSRCMRFDFKLIPQSDLEEHLKNILNSIGKEYEEEAVVAIARAGNGSVRDMLSIADICVSYDKEKLTYQGVNAVLGGADFDVMRHLCEAILQGNASQAVSTMEQILSEGKGVGIVVRDMLQFLHQCSVAKTCKNAKDILAMPKENFQAAQKIAEETDGHRLLRVTEIFAETESKLRYSTSAKIVLETAVMKASMPESDYDVEALLSRIAALEEKVKNGVQASVAPMAPQSQTREVSQPTEESPFDGLPPMAEPFFDEDRYAQAPIAPQKSASASEVRTERAETPNAPKTQPAAVTANQSTPLDRSKAFGMFLRTLRKNSKNGVLFTICSELDCEFDGDKMVLLSDSETIVNSLLRPQHTEIIAQALALIGVTEYEVKVKGQKSDNLEEGLKKIQKDFSNTPVTVQ